MAYVSGTCSVIKQKGIVGLAEHGSSFLSGKQTIQTPDGFAKASIHILGYGMDCLEYRLRILDGPRAGKEVKLRCSALLEFASTQGPMFPAAPNRTFAGMYFSEGMPITTKVIISKIGEAKCKHHYCYTFDEGTYMIGAGSDPLFLSVHFPKESAK